MADKNRLSVLLVTDKKDYAESLGDLIRSHYPNYHLAHTEDDVLAIFEKQPIDLMILGFETVQQNEVFYLHLLRARRDIDQQIAYIMLLAIKQDAQTAYDSCMKNIFNDYFLACPLYDINYILVRLREIERLIYGQQKLPLDEIEAYLEQMLTSGERLGQLTDETEQRIQNTLHEAMDHLRQQLEQQGVDDGTLQIISNQSQITKTTQLSHNPQLYESRHLIEDMVDRTREQRSQLGTTARGRRGDAGILNEHLDTQARALNRQAQSLADRLAEDSDQTRMDQVSPDNPIPSQGIMIIEDDMKQLSAINEALARLGLVTYPVQTGNEALKKMAEWKPAIALVDLTLPDVSALHVIFRISNHPELKHTRIIALANQNERDMVLEAAKTGIKQVVLKPVDRKLLTQRIQNNLDAIRLQEAETS